jgi:outer membrane protein assembly factor BamB
MFFLSENQLLHNFHLPTETTLWQFSVADFGASKVSKIMGVFGQVLVVVAEMQHPVYSGREAELYLGLDLNTGQLTWKTNYFINSAGEQEYFMG